MKSASIELTKSFKSNLQLYRDNWISTPEKNGNLQDKLYQHYIDFLLSDSGQNSPRVVVVKSIWQLTNLPLIISLMISDNSTNSITNALRSELKGNRWLKLWELVDQNFNQAEIERLRAISDKTHQESTLKEINKFMRKVHESIGTTFDTTDTPKLSSLGLQINSKFLADAKSLMLSLEEEMSAVVPNDFTDKLKTELASIPPYYERVETQLGLQIIPNILASSVHQIKSTLIRSHGNLTEQFTKSPGNISNLVKLIYQADIENRPTNIRATELWGGARIGAYGDPAVRLIASSLQLDLFRQSLVLDWLPIHIYMRDKIPDLYSQENDAKLTCWQQFISSAYAFVLYDNICFVCEPPSSVSLDEEGRYHNSSGPSLTFSDNTQIYSWHGRNVPKYIVEEPEKITIDKIDSERNIEIRTILIDRYGISRFLKDSGAKVKHKDEYGTLFQREFRDDEPLLVVMVKNSTPEPDGSFKHYFLRVPPNTLSAKAGIAWTFGLEEDEYEPDIQT